MVRRRRISYQQLVFGHRRGTVEFFSKISISPSFTAECAENAEASENPSVDWNALKLCPSAISALINLWFFRPCSVPKDTQVEGEVGKMTVPGGKYVVARFELAGSEEYENAWNKVFGEWLPESGYQPADSACYELYLKDPKEHPQGIHIVEICIPVKQI